MHRSIAIALVLAPLTITSVASGDEVVIQDDVSAQIAAENDPSKLFELGRALYKQERFEECYQAYKKTFELRESYDVAGNLGNVEVKIGKYTDAVKHLRYVLRKLPPSMDAEKRARVVEKTRQRLVEATQHVASVTLLSTPEGAKATVDGASVGTTPITDLSLDPGSRLLRLELDGYEPLEKTLQLTKGSAEEFSNELTKLSNVPGDEGGDSATGTGPSIPIVATGIGLGVVAAGAGVAMLVVSGNKSSEREDLTAQFGNTSACNTPTPPAECTQISELADDASTFQGVGIGLLVGGGVILAGTAVYALLPRDDEPTASWRVLPLFGSESGIVVQGEF